MKITKLNPSKQALWYLLRSNKHIFVPEFLLVVGAMIPITLMTLMPARIASSAFAGDIESVGLGVLIYFGLGAIHGILWHLADVWYVKYTYPLFYKTSTQTFKYILAKDYPDFVASSPSKMAQYINEMRDNIDRVWTPIHWGYIGFAIQTPAVIIISLKVSWVQALIYSISVSLMAATLSKKSIKLNKLMIENSEKDNDLNAAVIDSVTNFVNVKSFNSEAKEVKAFENLRRKADKQFQKLL